MAAAAAMMMTMTTAPILAQSARAPLASDPDAMQLALAAFDSDLFASGALEKLASVEVEPEANRIHHGVWPSRDYEPRKRHYVSEAVPIPTERLAVRSVYQQFLPDEPPIDFLAHID